MTTGDVPPGPRPHPHSCPPRPRPPRRPGASAAGRPAGCGAQRGVGHQHHAGAADGHPDQGLGGHSAAHLLLQRVMRLCLLACVRGWEGAGRMQGRGGRARSRSLPGGCRRLPAPPLRTLPGKATPPVTSPPSAHLPHPTPPHPPLLTPTPPHPPTPTPPCSSVFEVWMCVGTNLQAMPCPSSVSAGSSCSSSSALTLPYGGPVSAGRRACGPPPAAPAACRCCRICWQRRHRSRCRRTSPQLTATPAAAAAGARAVRGLLWNSPQRQS